MLWPSHSPLGADRPATPPPRFSYFSFSLCSFVCATARTRPTCLGPLGRRHFLSFALGDFMSSPSRSHHHHHRHEAGHARPGRQDLGPLACLPLPPSTSLPLCVCVWRSVASDKARFFGCINFTKKDYQCPPSAPRPRSVNIWPTVCACVGVCVRVFACVIYC